MEPSLAHTRSVEITNEAGLHARPCHALVSAALAFESGLRVRHGSREVNGKSILELMTLGAAQGAVLELSAYGPDAEDLLVRVVGLVESGFDEGA